MKERESLNIAEILIDEQLRLLKEADLTEKDLEIVSHLQQNNFSVSIHGSVVRKQMNQNSDIDFTAIGKFTNLPPSVKKLLPETFAYYEKEIDYISVSMIGRNGKRMSFHIEDINFPITYPRMENPCAKEYRPLNNLKKGKTSRYFLGAIDKKANIHVLVLHCPQQQITDGVINVTPQTGIFLIDENLCISNENPELSFQIERLATLNKDNHFTDMPVDNGLQLMLLGLEFDKMQSHSSLSYYDQ